MGSELDSAERASEFSRLMESSRMSICCPLQLISEKGLSILPFHSWAVGERMEAAEVDRLPFHSGAVGESADAVDDEGLKVLVDIVELRRMYRLGMELVRWFGVR